jgi:predicted nucleic acid-binding protein
MVDDRAFIDTNVLLAATDEGRTGHEAAISILTDQRNRGLALYWSGQIVREYVVVSTRPESSNGLGMPMTGALRNVDVLRGRLRLLNEDARVLRRLVQLLEVVDCTGKQVHDANVVATALTHGIETLVTANVRDFARFADMIRVVPPSEW